MVQKKIDLHSASATNTTVIWKEQTRASPTLGCGNATRRPSSHRVTPTRVNPYVYRAACLTPWRHQLVSLWQRLKLGFESLTMFERPRGVFPKPCWPRHNSAGC